VLHTDGSRGDDCRYPDVSKNIFIAYECGMIMFSVTSVSVCLFVCL